MEKTIVKFSRPLLFREDNGKYYLAYGLVLEEDKLGNGYDKDLLDEYMGYIAGMHLYAAGAGFFDVSYDCGISFWMDKKGNPHFIKDKWYKKMAEKCRGLLDLTYDVFMMEINEDTLAECVNSDYFITSEMLFDGQEMQGVELEDDLPF